jgi:hypothetical protein
MTKADLSHCCQSGNFLTTADNATGRREASSETAGALFSGTDSSHICTHGEVPEFPQKARHKNPEIEGAKF